MADEPTYDNIRHPELLGPFIGAKLIDVTQTDLEDLVKGEPTQVYLHFDNGGMLTFHITDDNGFEIEGGG